MYRGGVAGRKIDVNHLVLSIGLLYNKYITDNERFHILEDEADDGETKRKWEDASRFLSFII